MNTLITIMVHMIQLLQAGGMGGALGIAGSALAGPVGQIAGGIVGAGLGLITSGISNQMQLRQNQDLLNQQTAYNENLSEFNMGLQEQMWRDTNYSAQVQQAEMAGINPAMIWSKGGMGGGQTSVNTVATSQPNVMTNPALNIEEMIRSQQQAAVNAAAVNNTNQNTETQAAQQFATQQSGLLTQTQNKIASATAEDTISLVRDAVQTADHQASIAATNDWINQNTAQMSVDKFRQELAGIGLQNILTKAETSLTNEQISQVVNTIQQGWAQIDINKMNAQTNKLNYLVNLGQLQINEKAQVTNEQNADSNSMNALTNANRLQLEKYINDLPNSTRELLNGTISVLTMGMGAMKQGSSFMIAPTINQ